MKKTLVVAAAILAFAFSAAGCGDSGESGKRHLIAIENTLEAVFSTIGEQEDETGYAPGSVEELAVDVIVPGAFTKDGADEYLAVVKAEGDIAHAAGLYHAYMTVFDMGDGAAKSETAHFWADEGDYGIFEGKDRTYVFFTGAVVFQGDAQRKGGLYSIENGKWEKIWPSDESFWDEHMVDIRSTGLRVLKKRVISQEGLIPEIAWDFDHFLGWSEEKGDFIRNDREY